MNMSLLDNLLFGSRMEDIDRVRAILKRMEFDHVTPYFAEPRETWVQKLSYTDLACIHLARAFIVNPEVLVMHRPTIHFEENRREAVWSLLGEFIQNRGVEMPVSGREHRRPRTVFLSTSVWDEVKRADLIIFCHDQTAQPCKDVESITKLRDELKSEEKQREKAVEAMLSKRL
jgi:ABC-type multidrug transport system ATPase subunit